MTEPLLFRGKYNVYYGTINIERRFYNERKDIRRAIGGGIEGSVD